MFAIISPFSQSFDDIWLTYKIPENLENILKIWMIVKIPFWKTETLGIVLNISNETQLDDKKIKEIISIYSNDIFLNENQIKLLAWISLNYFCLIHASTNLFFPKNLIGKIQKNKFFPKETKENLNYTFEYKKSFNNNQKEVFDKIINSNKNKFLLYWVTWSWKTEIYINLIKYYLDLWKQSLLLVPEIILTNQIFDRIKEVFGDEVLVLNSTVSEAKKTNYWEKIYKNEAKIIVWTRSSLFYPYNNLWIIIIDEEHDNSYISDNSPRYDTIEVSEKITQLNANKLLLWSATPKINHFYKALNSDYEILNLFDIYNN